MKRHNLSAQLSSGESVERPTFANLCICGSLILFMEIEKLFKYTDSTRTNQRALLLVRVALGGGDEAGSLTRAST